MDKRLGQPFPNYWCLGWLPHLYCGHEWGICSDGLAWRTVWVIFLLLWQDSTTKATHKGNSLIQSLRPSWQGTRQQAGSHNAGAGAITKSLINKPEAERANWERCGLLKFKPSDTPPLKHSSQSSKQSYQLGTEHAHVWVYEGHYSHSNHHEDQDCVWPKGIFPNSAVILLPRLSSI